MVEVEAKARDNSGSTLNRSPRQVGAEAIAASQLSSPQSSERSRIAGVRLPAATVAGPLPLASTQMRHRDPPARVLGIDDMPVYPPDLVVAAKRSIKEISTDRVLLTYKEINAFFGISRATVARRLKDGLVPGIRIRHGRVLEDGPVRRLDRTQVLYLLLAVRARWT